MWNRVYTEEVDFFAIYHEQLDRWCRAPLTVAQRQEVERLIGQLARNREVDAAILTLAEALKATTIDAILAKSDSNSGSTPSPASRRSSRGSGHRDRRSTSRAR